MLILEQNTLERAIRRFCKAGDYLWDALRISNGRAKILDEMQEVANIGEKEYQISKCKVQNQGRVPVMRESSHPGLPGFHNFDF